MCRHKKCFHHIPPGYAREDIEFPNREYSFFIRNMIECPNNIICDTFKMADMINKF